MFTYHRVSKIPTPIHNGVIHSVYVVVSTSVCLSSSPSAIIHSSTGSLVNRHCPDINEGDYNKDIQRHSLVLLFPL